ncbi:hypothetical protein [Hymenobacter cellulosivorans]|uniref:STAS/SEC14 domain-containing protein n=1 Tax=Hymenobacter cellulosivorans TaxID=2932249 RepID=A0ABY4F4A8_9BACT|nr:hypothetical protein [Hymenobacter cellulosivorans]UOQ50897.1 hypothetical protein MUN80_14135 [Hymenobacter cellulosivorans]
MYHTLPAREFQNLSYRDDVCFIINRILRPLAPTEIQEAYSVMLEAANHYGCQHWLIDLRRDATYRPKLLSTFFPQPGDRAGSLTYLAYLVAPALLHDMEDQGDVPSQDFYDGQAFRARIFVDEQAAQDWLAMVAHT